MKTSSVLMLLVFLASACTSKKELSKEEAFQLLKQKNEYPRVFSYDIYCSDPQFAKRVIDAGLEEKGLVNVARTQKLADVGRPMIAFTKLAEPYLLPTSDQDKKTDIQKVKIADEDLIDVVNIKKTESPTEAVAEYTIAHKNVSAFSALTKTLSLDPSVHKAFFALSDDGWQIKK